jgi:hypothetical protein
MAPETDYNADYDPGFPVYQGFGQSATNPLAPVYYQSLGIVNDLSVYNSIYAARSVSADISFSVGDSLLSKDLFSVGVPTNFLRTVNCQQPVNCGSTLRVNSITNTDRLIVAGREFKPARIVTQNGSFTVLAAI